MTREEILQTFSDINYAYNNSSKYDTLKRMLDELTEPCEEAISRKAVLNTLDNMDDVLDEDRTVEIYKMLLTECVTVLPSVTPKPKTGHWIYTGDYLTDGMLKCSECGEEIDVSESYYDFCPVCGCRMVEPQESEG